MSDSRPPAWEVLARKFAELDDWDGKPDEWKMYEAACKQGIAALTAAGYPVEAVTEPLRAVLQEKDRIADLRTKGIRDRDATIAELTRERDEAHANLRTVSEMAAVARRERDEAEGKRYALEGQLRVAKQPHRPTDGTDGTTQFEEPGP